MFPPRQYRIVLASFVLVVTAQSFLLAEEAKPERELLVGILEHDPEENESKPGSFFARVAFKRGPEGWQAFPTSFSNQAELKVAPLEYPEKATWHVMFRGKVFETLTSSRLDDLPGYKDIGRHTFDSKQKVPTKEDRTLAFSGWMSLPTFRPLLLTTQATSDPDSWRDYTPLPDDKLGLEKYLRATYPATPEKWDRISLEYGSAFTSQKRTTKLIQVTIRDSLESADSLIPTSPSRQNGDNGWPDADVFFFLQDGKFSQIGTNLTYIDAADLDGNGRSEVIFMIQDYNMDGYLLLDDTLRRSTTFTWNYH